MKNRVAILRNVALVSVAGYIEAAVGLLVGVIIARALGPTDYGHYAFAVWLCGALILAINNALTTSSIKFLAEARGADREELAAALALRLQRLQTLSSALILAGFVGFMLVKPPSDWDGQLSLMLPIAIVAVWARAGFWMLGALGKGYERFEPENVALALTAFVNLAMVLTLTFTGGSVIGYFALYAMAGVVANVAVRVGLRKLGIKPRRGEVPAEMHVRFKRHVILTSILMLIGLATNRSVEMLMLKAYATAAEVGYFAIAGALTKGAVDLLAGGMAAVLLPAMARAYGRGSRSALAGMLSESVRLYWFIGLAIAGIGLTVTDGAVHLLYGARYEQAIPAVMWNLVIAGLGVVNGAFAAVLTASDRQGDRIKVVAIALVVNVIAGVLLIPAYGIHGAIGSLASTLCAEVIAMWWYASRSTEVAMPWSALARTALAAALATAVGVLVARSAPASVGFVLGGAVFVPLYVGASIGLRAWRARDFELFAGLAQRLGTRGAGLSQRVLRLRDRYALAD